MSMKLKHLPVLYGVYLTILVIAAIIIKLTVDVMTIKTLIICWTFFICISLIMIFMTAIAVINHRQHREELLSNVNVKKKSPHDDLREYATIFTSSNIQNLFFKTDVDRITAVISRMIKKLDNLEKLLENTFSKTDLTYTTYKNSLDGVIGAFNNNLKSIKKRIDVFDYRAWESGNRSDVSEKYISDIERLISQNEEIIDKLDYLISELVSLDDPKNFSLSNLNNLIRQTQDYKNINNNGGTT